MLPMVPVLWYNGPDSREQRRNGDEPAGTLRQRSALLLRRKAPGALPVSASLCGHGASLSRRLGEGTEEPDQLLLPQVVCRRLHPGAPKKGLAPGVPAGHLRPGAAASLSPHCLSCLSVGQGGAPAAPACPPPLFCLSLFSSSGTKRPSLRMAGRALFSRNRTRGVRRNAQGAA